MKRILKCILVCALMGGVLAYPAFAAGPFPDVDETAAYAEAVETMKELGIMVGDEKGNFNPNKTVTRAEMAAIVCRMLSKTENLPLSATFTDVPTSHWANTYVSKAAELKIVNGYGNGRFGPSDPVTYEQAVTMLIRAIGMEQQAAQRGGYPNGYITVAKNIGMLTNIFAENGHYMHRLEIATMAFNCKSAWGQGSTPGQMADGKYSVRISGNGLKSDQAGNELINAEFLEPVVLADSFVRALKVGDKIPVQSINGTYEIEVTMLDDGDDDVWINDYTYLAQYKSGWMIFENIFPVEYIAERREIQVPPSAKIIDAFTPTETGEGGAQEFESLRAFFEQSASYATIWSATITITSGRVTEVLIPYTPVGW